MTSSVLAIYPGTFDPITLGHQDMVRRAARLFDRVIVAVAAGHHKKTLFTLDERIALAQDAVSDLPRVQVMPFDGLLRDFVCAQGGDVMVRGVRNGSDFDYEFQLAGMNRHLMPQVETVCLMPHEKVQFISSTLVREIATLDGDVSAMVTPAVQRQLAIKLGK